MNYSFFDDFLQSRIDYINEYIDKKSNPASLSKFDPNANVESKNVASMKAEIYKDIDILVSRKMISDILEKEFDKETNEEYLRQIENHEIYIHDESTSYALPYCASIDLLPFVQSGMQGLDGESKAPKHLHSFCGNYVNLVFSLSSMIAGALSTPQLLIYVNYFAMKDYGENYLETHTKLIENFLQSIVYAINQPAMARGYQSAFLNLSLFDRYYFEGLFENFVYPDFSKPKWEDIDKLQRFFFTWLNKERNKSLLTFPVITTAIINDGKEFKDKDFFEYLLQELSEGNRTFIYTSDSADTLSSCCFQGHEVITVTSNKTNETEILFLKNFVEKYFKDDVQGHIAVKPDYSIFSYNKHTKKWEKTNIVSVLKLKNYYDYLLDFEFVTGELLSVTPDHLFIVTDINNNETEVIAQEIYMNKLFYKNILDKEIYSIKKRKFDGIVYDIGLEKNFYFKASNIVSHNCFIGSQKFISDKGIKSFEEFNHGDELMVPTHTGEWKKAKVYNYGQQKLQKVMFKRNHEEIEVVYCTKDHTWILSNEERTTNLKVGDKLLKAPNVQDYNIIKEWEVLDIQETNLFEDVWCLEVEDNHSFVLDKCIVTGNCRLKNSIKKEFNYTLTGVGIETGSKKVITINVNRMIQDGRNIREEVKKVHKYLYAHEVHYQRLLKSKMLPMYDAGFISLKKQYLTIGLNGIVEGAEFLGYSIDYNEDYVKFLQKLLGSIKEENELASKKYNVMINTELVPGENLGNKFCTWDKKDGYEVKRDIYNSYLYKVEDDNIPFLDKFKLHGGEITQYLDGGSALHLNLKEHPTKEAYRKLLNIMVKEKTDYLGVNVAETVCNNCGWIDKETYSICPKCKSNNIVYATRIIGYTKKISSFSEPRQKEADKRIYHK